MKYFEKMALRRINKGPVKEVLRRTDEFARHLVDRIKTNPDFLSPVVFEHWDKATNLQNKLMRQTKLVPRNIMNVENKMIDSMKKTIKGYGDDILKVRRQQAHIKDPRLADKLIAKNTAKASLVKNQAGMKIPISSTAIDSKTHHWNQTLDVFDFSKSKKSKVKLTKSQMTNLRQDILPSRGLDGLTYDVDPLSRTYDKLVPMGKVKAARVDYFIKNPKKKLFVTDV